MLVYNVPYNLVIDHPQKLLFRNTKQVLRKFLIEKTRVLTYVMWSSCHIWYVGKHLSSYWGACISSTRHYRVPYLEEEKISLLIIQDGCLVLRPKRTVLFTLKSDVCEVAVHPARWRPSATGRIAKCSIPWSWSWEWVHTKPSFLGVGRTGKSKYEYISSRRRKQERLTAGGGCQ